MIDFQRHTLSQSVTFLLSNIIIFSFLFQGPMPVFAEASSEFMYILSLCFQALCQVFAVALHYFFLANFSWLMNEAFNLYIVITYSSHAHGQQNDSGSLVRYYILGWSEYIEVSLTF